MIGFRSDIILCILVTMAITIKVPLYGDLQGNPSIKKGIKKRSEITDSALRGRPKQGYCMDIFLGTPKQKLTVILDTGSSNLAVSGITTDPIYFDKTKSTTYKEGDKSAISINYTEGYWSGNVGSDQISFCSSCKSSEVDLSTITKSDNFFVDLNVWQGILGLGYKALIQPRGAALSAPLNSLISGGVISKSFVVTLCGRKNLSRSNTQIFGYVDWYPDKKETYLKTRILKEWFYQIEVTDVKIHNKSIDVPCTEFNKPGAFVDSGTTNIILPPNVFDAVFKSIQDFTKTKTSSNMTLFLQRKESKCYADKLAIFKLFPNIEIGIAYNDTSHFYINVPPQQYIRQTYKSITTGGGQYCFMFGIEMKTSYMILGAAFMEYLNVLHDTESSVIGFTKANCNITEPEITKTISQIQPRQSVCVNAGGDTSHLVITILPPVIIFLMLLVAGAALLSYKYRDTVAAFCCRCCSDKKQLYVSE